MKDIEKEDLPLYYLSINPEHDAFVDGVALTDNPAIKRFYLAFNDESKQVLKFASDDAKQCIIGASMIPNEKIFRKANGAVKDNHYVAFTAEEIETISKQFFKNGFNKNININHTKQKVDAYFYQSIIVGDEVGQGKVNGLDDLPNGSWVLGAYIEDKQAYEDVKKWGFSVEGNFQYSEQIIEQDYQQELEIELTRLLNNLNK